MLTIETPKNVNVENTIWNQLKETENFQQLTPILINTAYF